MQGERHEYPVPGFTAALRSDVTCALANHLSGATMLSEERLRDIVRRVCSESRARGYDEAMMHTRLLDLLHRIPRFAGDDGRRDEAFGRMLTACAKAYLQ